MTDDPSNKHNQQPGQSGRQQQDQQSGHHQHRDRTTDAPQKRPSQGGYDIERDERRAPDQDDERRVS